MVTCCVPQPRSSKNGGAMSAAINRSLHSLFKARPSRSLPKTPKPPQVATASDRSRTDSSIPSKHQKFENLVKIFKESSDSKRFRKRYLNYESTVLRLAKAKRFSFIEDILEHQKQYKDISSELFAVRLISLYGKVGMFEHACKLFDEMPQLNCKRTVISFNALLAACVNSNKFNKIGEFFSELPDKLSVAPNRVSYNTVVKGFCEMGSLDSAVSVMDEMEKKGFEPDLITFNTLLAAFCRKNRLSDADKLWALMEDKNVTPDVRSYNPKLRGLVSDNRIPEAIELIEEMERKGVKPDIYSFNALIKGFLDDGNLEEAKRWYAEIERKNCTPSEATVKMLLAFVCDKGDFDFAFQLCKEAIKRHILIDKSKMQLVVFGLVEMSKLEEAKELVELGKSSFFCCKLQMPGDE